MIRRSTVLYCALPLTNFMLAGLALAFQDPAEPPTPTSELAEILRGLDDPDDRGLPQVEVGVRLVVGPHGTVTRCEITTNDNLEERSNSACWQLFGKVLFEPAMDGSRNPAGASYLTRLRWNVEPPRAANDRIKRADRRRKMKAETPTPMTLGPIRSFAVPLRRSEAWVTNDDYPHNLLRTGTEGIVLVEIFADSRGAPMKCVVMESSGISQFDSLACDLVTARASYKPTLDEAGKAIPTSYQHRIRWKLADP